MRRGTVTSLALAATCLLSCSGNGSADDRRLAAVVTAALEGEVCTFRGNGAVVSREALLQESVNLLVEAARREHAEQRRHPHEPGPPDGPGLVVVRVEAARRLPYPCFGPALRILERSGLSDVMLRLAGEQRPDQKAFFALEAPGREPRYAAIVRIFGGGGMAWNDEAIDLNGLSERVRAMDRQILDDVAMAPSGDADFGALYEAVRVIGQVKRMPTLLGCAGTAGPVRDPPIC